MNQATAILGIVSDAPEPRSACLRGMASELEHPASALEVIESAHVALGRIVADTADTARGALRPHQTRGSSIVVADARIDGPSELASSHVGSQELLGDEYERQGLELFTKLIGDFAIAVWHPEERALVCVRDALGVRPLYYTHLPQRGIFAFATEPKALLALSGVPADIDQLRVAQYLNGRHPDHESTFYLAIKRLPAGHWLRLRDQHIRTHRYWTPDPNQTVEAKTDAEYEELFRSRFVEAVDCRLAPDGKNASTLSGGLDSSSISAVAGSLAAQRGAFVDTYSATFPALPEPDLRRIDERAYQSVVAERPGIRPHQVVFDDPNPFAELEDLFRVLDGPCIPFNLYMHDEILRQARAHGASILLDGIDGDSVVSFGLGLLAELTKRGRWLQLWSEAKALADASPRKQYSTLYFVRELGLRPLAPLSLRRTRWRRRLRTGAYDRSSFIRPELAQELRLDERWRESQLQSIRPFRSAREEHALGLASPMLPFALELAAACANRHGLTMAFPFLDRRLVELCVALPTSQKLRRGTTRSILRRSLRAYVPSEITNRSNKANLEPAFRTGVVRHAPALMRQVLNGDQSRASEVVDLHRLERDVEAFTHPTPNRHDTNPSCLRIFEGLTTALWLQSQVPISASQSTA